MKCASCGGKQKTDAWVKSVLGCDVELPEGKSIRLPDGSTTRRCPRFLMRPVSHYLNAHAWWTKGQLHHVCPPEDTPAVYLEAFNVIEDEHAKMMDDIYKGK